MRSVNLNLLKIVWKDPDTFIRWLRANAAEDVYAAFFEVLKPGGVLGVVQHRAGDGTDTSKFNGYVEQDKVIALATEQRNRRRVRGHQNVVAAAAEQFDTVFLQCVCTDVPLG